MGMGACLVTQSLNVLVEWRSRSLIGQALSRPDALGMGAGAQVGN
jgi:hypothetical protein